MAVVQKEALISSRSDRGHGRQDANDITLFVDGIEVWKAVLIWRIGKGLVFPMAEHISMVSRSQIIRPYDVSVLVDSVSVCISGAREINLRVLAVVARKAALAPGSLLSRGSEIPHDVARVINSASAGLYRAKRVDGLEFIGSCKHRQCQYQ